MSKNIKLTVEIDSLSVFEVAEAFRAKCGWNKQKATNRQIAEIFIENLIDRYFHPEYLDAEELEELLEEGLISRANSKIRGGN